EEGAVDGRGFREPISGHSPPVQLVPWPFLYFSPLPQGQGSSRPTFLPSRRTVWTASVPPSASLGCARANAEGASVGSLNVRLRGSARAPAIASSGSRTAAGRAEPPRGRPDDGPGPAGVGPDPPSPPAAGGSSPRGTGW